MNKKRCLIFIVTLLVAATAVSLTGCGLSGDVAFTVSHDNVDVSISQDLYGLFLEDISYAGDGGLVSDLVNNGSFEYEAIPLAGWRVEGAVDCSVTDERPLNEKNTRSLKVTSDGVGRVDNIGFVEYYDYLTENYDGELMNAPDMGFKEGEKYELSFYFLNADFDGVLSAGLSSEHNCVFVDTGIDVSADGWQKISLTLTSSASEDGKLSFDVSGKGTFYMDFVSLVPESSYGYGDEEWKYVSLRADLVEALENLSPSFIRFPGGCLAEGDDIDNLFDWKNTIGPLEQREQTYNIWNDDGNGKAYNNTFALGYHEYLQLCDDLGAKPLPILNAGMICQFEADYNAKVKERESGKMTDAEWEAYLDTVALRPGTEEFDAYVQDILDLIEYCNGDAETTYWGARRAENGHYEPFCLEYVGIGNENWGELYWRNFDAIYKVLQEKHPEITVISSASYEFEGERIDDSWEIINEKYKNTLVDEHYYTGSNTLFRNNDRYDSYPRDGAKVFVGEYAATCWGFGKYITKNNVWAAIEEAGYLTALERNGDLVQMASYAPTFAKVNANCWDVNMIWFDSQGIALTPNYFVQMLFANNYGKNYVNTECDADGVYTSTTVDEDEQVIYVKIVNAGNYDRSVNLSVDGFGALNAASVQYFSGEKGACNEIGKTTVLPVQKDCVIDGSSVSTVADACSVNVIRIYYGDNDGSGAYSLPEVPSTMQSKVTEYDRFYVVPETLIVLAAAALVCIMEGAVIALLEIRAHFRSKKSGAKQ